MALASVPIKKVDGQRGFALSPSTSLPLLPLAMDLHGGRLFDSVRPLVVDCNHQWDFSRRHLEYIPAHIAVQHFRFFQARRWHDHTDTVSMLAGYQQEAVPEVSGTTLSPEHAHGR